MRSLYIAILFLFFVALSIVWVEVIMKLIYNMNEVHIIFCMFIPIVLIIWYICSGLIFTSINQQFKKIRYKKRNY